MKVKEKSSKKTSDQPAKSKVLQKPAAKSDQNAKNKGVQKLTSQNTKVKAVKKPAVQPAKSKDVAKPKKQSKMVNPPNIAKKSSGGKVVKKKADRTTATAEKIVKPVIETETTEAMVTTIESVPTSKVEKKIVKSSGVSTVSKAVMKPVKQSALSKAVKNVKKQLLTEAKKKPESKAPKEPSDPSVQKDLLIERDRGVVYVGHIPHGFFEQQMHDYFRQFGKVTRVRLVRSKKTGRSQGFGYVEFQHSDVAKIAAESMNNYLMSGRLLRAAYIPPEKQHPGYFQGVQWSKTSYPRLKNRRKQNKLKNNNVDNKTAAGIKDSMLTKLSNIEKKLAAKGIHYKIKPVEAAKA